MVYLVLYDPIAVIESARALKSRIMCLYMDMIPLAVTMAGTPTWVAL